MLALWWSRVLSTPNWTLKLISKYNHRLISHKFRPLTLKSYYTRPNWVNLLYTSRRSFCEKVPETPEEDTKQEPEKEQDFEYIDDFEFTEFDSVPKQYFTKNDIILEEDRDPEYDHPVRLYQSLIWEIVAHLKGDNFENEFAPFVKNNDTLLKLLCLHMFMVAHSLMSNVYHPEKSLNFKERTVQLFEIRATSFMMNACKYPPPFHHFLYREFHSHLPQELFFEDYYIFIKRNSIEISKQMRRYYSARKQMKSSEKQGEFLRNILHKHVIDWEEFDVDHPLVKKLQLYVEAHVGYLETLEINELIYNKVSWCFE